VPRPQEWWIVVLSTAIAGVFIVLERVGAVIDAPFENLVTDVPLTALSTAIERDLREQLGDAVLPAPVVAVDGYLW
jgi:putative membrane protein